MTTELSTSAVTRARAHPTTMLQLVTVVGLSSGVANVIMQLSLPPVGHGVDESRVVSGSPRRYPMKRARTTGTYLSVALLGTEAEQAHLRGQIGVVHKSVVSTARSPMHYSGNSPGLQLWVAACLFRFYLDQYTMLYGDLPEPDLDVLTRAAEPLATGVNVRASAWPQTWREFNEYWDRVIPQLSIAPTVRHDFETLSNLEFLIEAWGPIARPVVRVFGRRFQFLTRAYLPAEIRELMGWTWTPHDQAEFDRVVRRMRVADRVGGRYVAIGLVWSYLLDFRLRRRFGVSVLGPPRMSDVPIKDGGERRRIARWTTRRSKCSALD